MDTVAVYFTGLKHVFHVRSVLAQFSIFGHDITIRWYGAIIAFGFLLAVLMGGRMAYKWKMSLDKMVDVLIYGTFGGIIGARLYYVIFRWSYYSAHPAEIIQIWNGGLAIYGGIIGGIICAYITAKVDKLNFFNLLDCVGMSLLIGQGIGRWGNYANQEAFGTNTAMPWGMKSEKTIEYLVDNREKLSGMGISVDPYLPVHPTFLYESLWCLGSFIILFIIYKKARKFSGQLFLTYCVLYGTGRAVIEGFRTDSLYLFDTGIRVSQLLSITAALIALGILIALLIKYTKNPKPIEGVDYFIEDERKKKKEKAGKVTGSELRMLAQKRAERNPVNAQDKTDAAALPARESVEEEMPDTEEDHSD